MKCKTFKIHLAEDARIAEEINFNKFLETITVRQTFAEIVGGEFWSILVFYEDSNSIVQKNESVTQPPFVKPLSQNPKSQVGKTAAEPLALSAEQEQKFTALKNWRNERAAADGVPPYLIAQNDSLMQIAAEEIETAEDLTSIKGFGEKRAQKYGDEILRVLSE
ncbi:MAG TPA: HRDC domain-containing protein [Pyrinomonadaceae bacterium]|jgi:ATP-dependent DNA helicase RecQ